MAEQEIGTGARPPAPKTSRFAVASLVLGIAGFIGILGFFFLSFFGILLLFLGFLILEVLAIVFGVKARRAIARSAGRLQGKGLALAGMILGIVHLAMYIVIVPLLILRCGLPYRCESLTRSVRVNETRALIREVNIAILEYHNTWNDYPANLYSDLAKRERNGPFLSAAMDTYIKNGSIVDAWGNPFVYDKGTTMSSGVPIIKSYGPDGRNGGGDDITNDRQE